MIESLYTIDLITAAGTIRLVTAGDILQDEPRLDVRQSMDQYAPIKATWGETSATGGAFVNYSFAVRKEHASHAAARSWCMAHAASRSIRLTGTLRVAITGGDTWDIEDASLSATSPQMLVGEGTQTLTAFTIMGGRMVPAAAITLYAGIPWDYILQAWENISTNWEAL